MYFLSPRKGDCCGVVLYRWEQLKVVAPGSASEALPSSGPPLQRAVTCHDAYLGNWLLCGAVGLPGSHPVFHRTSGKLWPRPVPKPLGPRDRDQ